MSTSRPCERRDPYGEDFRFGNGGKAFLTFEDRGYGFLRSQGRPAESLCEATTASTRGSIQSYAIGKDDCNLKPPLAWLNTNDDMCRVFSRRIKMR